jgi:hypothetical protein
LTRSSTRRPARAVDASEDELDAFVRQLRIDHCDLTSVITSAAWLAVERARLAQLRSLVLPAPSWATTAEIADDRGAPLDHVTPLVDGALERGLLVPHARGVVVTQAGHQHVVLPSRA